jgi:hypothetical protein
MKKILFALLCGISATKFAAWLNRRRVSVLCCHGVTEPQGNNPDDSKGPHVSHLRFATHFSFAQRHDSLISLPGCVTPREATETSKQFSVVLTFADGFRSSLTVAAPLLFVNFSVYGVPSCLGW